MNCYESMSEEDYKRVFQKMEKLLLGIRSQSLLMNGNLEMLMKSIFGVACEKLGYGPFVMDKKFSSASQSKKGALIDLVGFDLVCRKAIPFEFKCTFAEDASSSKKAAKDAVKKATAYRKYAFPRVCPRIVHFLNTSDPSSCGPWPSIVRSKFPRSANQMSLDRLKRVYQGEKSACNKEKKLYFMHKFRNLKFCVLVTDFERK